MTTANGPETFGYRLARMERELEEARRERKEMAERIDKVVLAVVGFALTLAVFGLGIAVTLLSTGPG